MSSDFNRYERCLQKAEWASPAARSAFCNAAYETRRSSPAHNVHERTIWNTGANVIGPLYTAFVWWTLKKAGTAGIKRLYFMARDGLILKEIADLLISTSHFDIEARYLHVSRESLLYPSIVDIDQFDLRWILWPIFKPVTVAKLLKRLNLDGYQVKEFLAKHGFHDLQRPLGLFQKLKFRHFIKDPAVQKLIRQKAAEKYELVIAFLKQEGLADGTPFAVVDLGWLALSQYAISRMLDREGTRPSNGVKGYYLGTNCLLWAYKNDPVDSFLFNAQNMFDRIRLIQYELPETFATVPQGRTLGYRREQKNIQPVLGDINSRAKEWGCEKQREAALEFVKHFTKMAPPDLCKKEQPNAGIGEIFDQFCNFPSEDEAATYGKFFHGADMEGTGGHEIAPVVKWQGLPRLFTGYHWTQGSIYRSHLPGKNCLLVLAKLTNLFRHIVLKGADTLFFKKPHAD